MILRRLKHLLFAVASALGSLVAWPILQGMICAWRSDLPVASGPSWMRLAASGSVPWQKVVLVALDQTKRWAVANVPVVQIGFVVIVVAIVVRQLAMALGIAHEPNSHMRADSSWRLQQVLLRWTDGDHWTLGNAFEGTLIGGGTGSGKSSGSGRAVAKALLRTGAGGVVLTAKSDERQVWESYCRETGRSRDLIVFGPSEKWRFNFLEHELTRQGAGAGLTENICRLFLNVLEVCDSNSSSGSGKEDEGYWRRALEQLLRNTVELQSQAKKRIAVNDLYRIVISAPQSMDEVRSDDWKRSSYCYECLAEADAREKSPREFRDLEMVADYFTEEFPKLSDKTRSVIVSTFTSTADVLNRGILRELLCSETNLTPEVTEQGKVIVVDLPVREFGAIGRICQVLLKVAFQRSIERRDVSKSPRPVFLFADEFQNFVTSYDQQFQTTCRSARVATVLLTQNISNIEAALGGEKKGHAETMSLLGNLNTKFFHCNSDPQTNEFAANLIGRSRVMLATGNHSYGNEDWLNAATGLGPAAQTSAGYNETFEFEVQPAEFTRLKTGGPANKGVIEAIVFQNGRQFRTTGRTWLPVTFQQ